MIKVEGTQKSREYSVGAGIMRTYLKGAQLGYQIEFFSIEVMFKMGGG